MLLNFLQEFLLRFSQMFPLQYLQEFFLEFPYIFVRKFSYAFFWNAFEIFLGLTHSSGPLSGILTRVFLKLSEVRSVILQKNSLPCSFRKSFWNAYKKGAKTPSTSLRIRTGFFQELHLRYFQVLLLGFHQEFFLIPVGFSQGILPLIRSWFALTAFSGLPKESSFQIL